MSSSPKSSPRPSLLGTGVFISSQSQLWDRVLQKCQSMLDPEDFQKVCQLGSIEELVKYGKSLQEAYKQKGKSYDLSRMHAFFNQLRTFHSSLDVLVHVNPAIAAPLWGSLKLCVELVHATEEVLQLIVEMFDEVNDTLPRIEKYVQLLGNEPSLVEPCEQIYVLIAEFACSVIVYFRKHRFKNLILATWKPFRPDFEQIVNRIRQKSRQIELEVHALSLQQNAAMYEQLRRLQVSGEVKSRTRLPCHHVPFEPNSLFRGRAGVLEEMHRHMSSVQDGVRAISIHGLGGMGKSQTCLEYYFRHAKRYEAAFWISADKVEKLAADVRTALVHLGILSRDSTENDEQCRNTFTDWLRDTDVPWLLMFDNADDLKTLNGYWPVSKRGHILLTSRDPASARYRSPMIMKGIQLTPLDDKDGSELLLSFLNENASNPASPSADFSAEEVRVANYMLDSGCELEELHIIFTKFADRSALLDEGSSNLHMSYPHSFNAVWEMSMSRIEATNAHSHHLLQLLSTLDPDGVPQGLLDGSHKQHNGSQMDQLSYLSDKLKYLNATKALTQQSMISKGKVEGRLSMHRLVGEITQKKMTLDDRQARFEEALELLYRVYPQLSTEKAILNDQWSRCRLYIPQVRAIELYFRESDPPLKPQAKFATVLANASWFLYEQGLLEQAMEILPTARHVGEKTLQGNEFNVSTIHRALGGIAGDVNNPNDALSNFSRQLDCLQALGERDSLPAAHGYSNVALAELALHDYDAALKHVTKAQDIRSRYPGQAKSARALTLDVYGITEGLRGNYDDAVRQIQQAMALYDEEQGVGNYLSAFAKHELGNIYLRKGQPEEAFQTHTQSLAERRVVVGDTYRTASTLHKVAWYLQHRKNDSQGAETLLLEALKIYEGAYKGKGGTSRSSYLMSEVLTSLNRPDDAQNTKKLAAEIRQEILGIPPDQDDFLDSYDQLVSFQDQ